jgi:Arc/MetJ-type ribon-helix-helix transcriptional regulator
MKVSISLPDDDVAFLDDYAREHGVESRSAVLQQAVVLLRTAGLSDDYAAAWDEWSTSADAEAWETTSGDGLGT